MPASKKAKKPSGKTAAAREVTFPETDPASAGQPGPEMIRIPVPVAASFNPQRPLHKNKLIQTQVAHFKEVYEQLPEEHKTIKAGEIETEAQASEFIREVTARLHAHHGIARPAKAKRAT